MDTNASRITRAAALALALAASAAQAAEWFSEIGYGRVDFGSSFADTPDTYNVGLGVLFNAYFGAQLDWAYAGTPSLGPCPGPFLCVTAITPDHLTSLRALGRLPLGESFELIGGFGRVQHQNGPYDYTVYADRVSLSVGWRINETFTLSLQRQVDSVDSGFYDTDTDTVTLRYRF